MRHWIIFLLIGLFLILVTPLYAQGKAFEILNYDIDLALQPDGAYHVTERITFDFQQGTFTFATRNIPLKYIDVLRDVRVESPNVVLKDVTHTMNRREALIRWEFEERTGPTTFVLSYRVEGALFARQGDNVIDWDAIGTGWSVPIHDVDVRVQLPATLSPANIRYEPADEGRLLQTDQGITITYHYPNLPPHTAYRVIVSFPQQWPGREKAVSRIEQLGLFNTTKQQILAATIVGMLGVLPGMFVLLQKRWPKSVTPSADKPAVSLPWAAVLLYPGPIAGQQAFPAVIFDLAKRGHLTLRRVPHRTLIFNTPHIEIEVHETTSDLDAFERALCTELRNYPSLEKFGARAHSFRKQWIERVIQELVAGGYMRDNRRKAVPAIVAGAILDGLAVLAGVFWGSWVWVIAGLVMGLSTSTILMGITHQFTLTARGVALRTQIQAYLEYLREQIEELRSLDPVGAARLYMEEIPWITLAPYATSYWTKKLSDSLKEAHAQLRVPDWVMDVTGQQMEAASEAYQAFQTYYHVTSATRLATVPASSSSGGGGGAGAGGGAGGGGGSAG